MYKLFLCLRYLRSRVIAYFAVLAVALCVAMMLIVISVMNGFLDKIERAAKGLFGPVVHPGKIEGDQTGKYSKQNVKRQVVECQGFADGKGKNHLVPQEKVGDGGGCDR